MSYILNIYTNPATDYIIDPEPVANLVANKSLFQMLPCFLLRSVCRAQPCHRCLGERFCIKTKKSQIPLRLDFERKTRLCPSALHSVYQAIAFAQYYTPNSRDTWVVSRCRFRVRLLPYKLQNYSCLRQIYE